MTENTDEVVNRRINQQGERLFTVRPRYHANFKDGKRGEISTIRLLRSYELSEEDKQRRAATAEYNELLALAELEGEQGYHSFLMQGIQYSMVEKKQVFHTFGGREAVYFYGENPVEFQVNGLVTDDLDNDSFTRFAKLYSKYLRGTQSARDFALVELSLPNLSIVGSITSLSFVQNSERDTDIGFSMTIMAKSYFFQSTDKFYKDDEGEVIDYISETFLTTAPYQAELQASMDKIRESQISADDPASILPNTVPGVSDSGAELAASGIYTLLFDTPQGVKDFLGFLDEYSLSDQLQNANDFLQTGLGFAASVQASASDLIGGVTGYLSDIENGLDDIMDTVSNTVGTLQNTANQFQDAWGTVTNFPESICNKIGRFLENGLMTPDGVSLTGSSYVTQQDAEALLKTQARSAPGPERGTQLDPGVGTTADDNATLTF